ncbi:hypothetical protein BRADI_3g57957v3 [Brachypodium distachyon]|uniref:Uncharacterized protein n=1 Tax=Brachypodium distachyon TaxID=15368 RepID=A0A2K2D5N1_BRADI|nr:hypothetical protein BRADI_3g57957v3 [Brachypodium distachyon]
MCTRRFVYTYLLRFVFVGFIFCNFVILLWRSDENLTIRRLARLGDQRSWLLIFLDEPLKGLFETFQGSQIRAGY